MRMSLIPARTASSTTYWIAGLSTTGSISLGIALVAGRKRVPSPAAGMTALRTVFRAFITQDYPCGQAIPRFRPFSAVGPGPVDHGQMAVEASSKTGRTGDDHDGQGDGPHALPAAARSLGCR